MDIINVAFRFWYLGCSVLGSAGKRDPKAGKRRGGGSVAQVGVDVWSDEVRWTYDFFGVGGRNGKTSWLVGISTNEYVIYEERKQSFCCPTFATCYCSYVHSSLILHPYTRPNEASSKLYR